MRIFERSVTLATLAPALLLAACASPAADDASPEREDAETAEVVDGPAPQGSATLPFTLRFVEKQYPEGSSPPAIQSFVAAPGPAGEWLVVCGRTQQGMHGFAPEPPNFLSFTDRMYVVDPETGATRSFELSQLEAELADPLRSTNAQGFYDAASDRLYLVGGYGVDSSTQQKVTFDTITAFDVSDMVAAIQAEPQDAQQIAGLMTRSSDPRLQVTGGGLAKLGGKYFLVFGQTFTGEYVFAGPHDFTQTYTEEVRVFTLDEKTLAIGVYAPVGSQDTSKPFHRRDVNIRPAIDPATGEERIGVYAGVFPPGQLAAWTNPVYIGADTTAFVDDRLTQTVNMYECATVPIYDGAGKVMYQTFFGGITGSDPQPIETVKSSSDGLPWTNLVSTVVYDPGAATPYAEWLLPTLASATDSYVGGEAEFIVSPALVGSGQATASGIVRLDRLAAGSKTLVGHVYGGIQGEDAQGTNSAASARVFEVWLDLEPCPVTAPGQS